MLPATVTPTTAAFDDLAVYVSGSPSGSLKYEDATTASLSPSSIVSSGILPTGAGAWLGDGSTVTVVSALPVAPCSSVAISRNVRSVSFDTAGALKLALSVVALLILTFGPARNLRPEVLHVIAFRVVRRARQ